MNQYLGDSSGLSAGLMGLSVDSYQTGAKSTHKPAESAPQQAQAEAAFNNAAYMPSTSTSSAMPQQPYQQPAQQAQRSAPPPTQAPEQTASQAQTSQPAQTQVQPQQGTAQQGTPQQGADDMYSMMYNFPQMADKQMQAQAQQMAFMQMGGAAAGKGLQGQGMMGSDQMTQQMTPQQQQFAATWAQQNMMNMNMNWGQMGNMGG